MLDTKPMKRQSSYLFFFALSMSIFLLAPTCDVVQFPRVHEDPKSRSENSILGNCKNPNACIAIVTHSTLDVKYLNLAFDNHKRYAKKFHYDYIFRNNLLTERFIDPLASSRVFQLGLYWQKIESVTQALTENDALGNPKYQWVLWVDPDILFTNFDISLESLIDTYGKGKDFLISQENFTYTNAGIFLVRNTPFSKRMMKDIANLFPRYKTETLPEQLAIQDYSLGFVFFSPDGVLRTIPEKKRNYNKASLNEVNILPQRVLNSFYRGNIWLPGASSKDAVWQPGDFIAHFAVVFSEKKNLMQALSDCFKTKCGDHYEDHNDCIKQCE